MLNNAEVSKALNTLQNIDKKRVPKLKTGHMDVYAFNRMPEVIEVKNKLKALGVKSNKELMRSGYVAAGMILKFCDK